MTEKPFTRLRLLPALTAGFCAGFILPFIVGIGQLAMTVVGLMLVMFQPAQLSAWPTMGGIVNLLVPLLLCAVTVPAGLLAGFLAWLVSAYISWARYPAWVYLILNLLLLLGLVFGLANLPLLWAVNLTWPLGGFYLLGTTAFAVSVVLPLWLMNLMVILTRGVKQRRSLRLDSAELVKADRTPA